MLVSDLAPGQSGVDDMKLLEQKAQQLAAEAEQDKPKPKDKILFVRYVLHPSLRQATQINQSMQPVWHIRPAQRLYLKVLPFLKIKFRLHCLHRLAFVWFVQE